MKKIVFEKPRVNNPYYERECPKWYRDAKIGIFVHWGPYSVPAWAPMYGGITELAKMMNGHDIDSVNTMFSVISDQLENGVIDINTFNEAMSVNPYAEWYWNSMATENSPTQKHHRKTYGNKKYEDFADDFRNASENWDPNTWADLFEEAGAKYVITTSKHHDGFCLWPTDNPNPQIKNWHTTRDLMGDLKKTLDNKDIRFSLYYSAGLDWSLSGVPIPDDISSGILQTDEAIEYFDAQVIEIIDKYKPSLIWQDIGYPQKGDFNKILEHYYKVVPDGVISDRAQTGLTIEATRHFDYTTTEYFVPQSIREVPWEICRGISNSFAYNQLDNENSTLSVEELIESLADVVSKNGNLLLGLGPKADGSIPEHQVKVVKEFGQWLNVNGEAIYDTRPYERFDDETNTGNKVRYTMTTDFLYAIVLGSVEGNVVINNLTISDNADIELLGHGKLERKDRGVVFKKKTSNSGCVLKVKLSDLE